MSKIYQDLTEAVAALAPHAAGLTSRDSYAPTMIRVELETSDQFDALLAADERFVEEPSGRLYSGKPFCRHARADFGEVVMWASCAIPTVMRACEFCGDKHDCTHTDGRVA